MPASVENIQQSSLSDTWSRVFTFCQYRGDLFKVRPPSVEVSPPSVEVRPPSVEVRPSSHALVCGSIAWGWLLWRASGVAGCESIVRWRITIATSESAAAAFRLSQKAAVSAWGSNAPCTPRSVKHVAVSARSSRTSAYGVLAPWPSYRRAQSRSPQRDGKLTKPKTVLVVESLFVPYAVESESSACWGWSACWVGSSMIGSTTWAYRVRETPTQAVVIYVNVRPTQINVYHALTPCFNINHSPTLLT